MKRGRGLTDNARAAKLSKQSASPIDAHVGMRIKARRILLGLSQERLADHAGLKPQTIQKYESGEVRIAASRLLELSQILGVPVQFFFDGLNSEHDRVHVGISNPDIYALLSQILSNHDAIEFNKVVWMIEDACLRRSIAGLVHALASSSSTSDA